MNNRASTGTTVQAKNTPVLENRRFLCLSFSGLLSAAVGRDLAAIEEHSKLTAAIINPPTMATSPTMCFGFQSFSVWSGGVRSTAIPIASSPIRASSTTVCSFTSRNPTPIAVDATPSGVAGLRILWIIADLIWIHAECPPASTKSWVVLSFRLERFIGNSSASSPAVHDGPEYAKNIKNIFFEAHLYRDKHRH